MAGDNTTNTNNASQSFSNSQNPLINPPVIANGAPALDLIKAEHFEPAFKWGLKQAQNELDALINNPDAPTFENTIEALAFLGQDLSRIYGIYANIDSIDMRDEIIDITKNVIIPEISPFYSKISFNKALFQRVQAVYAQKDTLSLTTEQKVLLEETYKSFADNGANLPQAEQDEIIKVNQNLKRLTTQYSENVNKSQKIYSKLIDDAAELSGIPDEIIAELSEAAEAKGHKGKWLITFENIYTILEIQTYADNRDLRRELTAARGEVANAAPYDNNPVIKEILALRERKAKLLGHNNHADYVLSDRMAGNGQTALDFVEENRAGYYNAAKADFEEVKQYALNTDGITDFDRHDFYYYSEKLKKDKFGFDTQELKPYFSLDNVLDGLFQHVEKLFNISFKGADDKYPVYHEDMHAYEVYDKDDSRLVGVFYTDYFARADKKGGAWANMFRGAGKYKGAQQVPLVVNCCNYSKPTKDYPSLLSYDDVETAFHEFGHGLHALLGNGEYESLTGFNVKWDFVEFPSHLQENWVKQKEVLQSFATHHKTGAVIPDDLIDKNIAASQFQQPYQGLRQSYLGLIDLKLHTTPADQIGDLIDFDNDVAGTAGFFPASQSTSLCSFSHIFSSPVGYAAGYYSYKWAEALEADAFTAFEAKGLYDRPTADALKVIYSAGGTVPPDQLFKNFMGRDPDPAAMFRRAGVNTNNAAVPTPPKPSAP